MGEPSKNSDITTLEIEISEHSKLNDSLVGKNIELKVGVIDKYILKGDLGAETPFAWVYHKKCSDKEAPVSSIYTPTLLRLKEGYYIPGERSLEEVDEILMCNAIVRSGALHIPKRLVLGGKEIYTPEMQAEWQRKIEEYKKEDMVNKEVPILLGTRG